MSDVLLSSQGWCTWGGTSEHTEWGETERQRSPEPEQSNERPARGQSPATQYGISARMCTVSGDITLDAETDRREARQSNSVVVGERARYEHGGEKTDSMHAQGATSWSEFTSAFG